MDSEKNKIKTSDTPRSDAAEYHQYDTQPPLPLGLVDVEFARKLEAELNTAIVNEAFAENKVYMLEKQLKQANDRIKRLEDAGDVLFENSYPTMWDLPAAADQKLTDQSNWLKAKEAKP